MTLRYRIAFAEVALFWALTACSDDVIEEQEPSTSVAVSALSRAKNAQSLRRTEGPNAQAYHGRANHKKHAHHPHHGIRSCAAKPALLTPDVVARFAESIEPLRTTTRIPGAAVALVECGQIRYEAGFGVRDLDSKQPVTPRTVFRVGSTTKAMTSTLIATWVDEGRLDFDTRAVDILPSFELPTSALTDSVTVAQLMGMGTGLDEPLPLWWGLRSAGDLFESLASLPVLSEPGVFLYNSYVYASVGYLGQYAAGVRWPSVATYASAMEHRLFRPLGMYPAAISDRPASVSPDHAHSYGVSLAHGISYEEPLPLYPIGALAPAGSAVTSVEGLARFVIMQLNRGVAPNGSRIVSETNLLRTRVPQTPIYPGPAAKADYAMGWVSQDNAGVQTVWHNGSIDAFGTLMWTVPEDGLGLVVLANGYYANEFYVALQETLMRLVYGSSNADPAELIAAYQASDAELASLGEVLAQQPRVDRTSVEPYLGKYEHELVLDYDPARQELVLTAPGMRSLLTNVEALTGQTMTFVVSNGGPVLLQVLRLVTGNQGPELVFLDSETFAPEVVLQKMP